MTSQISAAVIRSEILRGYRLLLRAQRQTFNKDYQMVKVGQEEVCVVCCCVVVLLCCCVVLWCVVCCVLLCCVVLLWCLLCCVVLCCGNVP